MAESIVRKKSYAFALRVIALCQGLSREKEFVLSRQLLKSGTSVGANVEEALAAQSRKDFISKMSIASKEARETLYWLRLLRDSRLTLNPTLDEVLQEAESLVRMLTSIIKTTKETSATKKPSSPQPGVSEGVGVYCPGPHSNPRKRRPKSTTLNPKLKTHNSKLATRNPQTKTQNSKPKTQNP